VPLWPLFDNTDRHTHSVTLFWYSKDAMMLLFEKFGLCQSQNSAIPAALWCHHTGLCQKIPTYQPKLGMVESPKTATDPKEFCEPSI